MVEISREKNRDTVRIVCDVCKKRITDAEMAMVRWRRTSKSDANITNLTFCHKGSCDDAASKLRADDPWFELTHFLARLIFNSGMGIDSIEKAMKSIGVQDYCEHETVETLYWEGLENGFRCVSCKSEFSHEDHLASARMRAEALNRPSLDALD